MTQKIVTGGSLTSSAEAAVIRSLSFRKLENSLCLWQSIASDAEKHGIFLYTRKVKTQNINVRDWLSFRRSLTFVPRADDAQPL